LHRAGVQVSLAPSETAVVRDLIWEAGYQHRRDPELISEAQAIGLVTWQLADTFRLPLSAGRIQVGKAADFVAYDGSPLQFGSRITLVSSSYQGVACYPTQA
jgi:imidazolonepropionase-like amidohydrolase